MLKRLTLAVVFLAAICDERSSRSEQSTPFNVTTKRTDDRVDAKLVDNKLLLSIHSPFGISRAVIDRASQTWPESIIVRLHLKGLEKFKVATEKVKLEGSVSIQDGKTVPRIWKNGNEDDLLDAKSPYWIKTRVVTGDGDQAKEFPLVRGYFELRLTDAILRDNPTSITIEWIDFYRN